jgi:hypothetical protein
MQIQNCVSISQVVLGVVVERVIPKMGNCDFWGLRPAILEERARSDLNEESSARRPPRGMRPARRISGRGPSLRSGDERIGHPLSGRTARKFERKI